MFLPFYSALLTLALVVSAPWWLYRMATTRRYREGLAQRLGLISPVFRQTVEQAHAQGRRTLWLHAVSVGELLAATPLIAALQTALPTHLILISTTTATGQKLARERFPPAHVFYLPLDLATPVRRYLNLLRPDLLILMESELWPRLLAECARRNIPVTVANARISDRSFPRYKLLRPLWRPILAKISLILAQSEETAQRLRILGANPTKIQTPGNLKYDLASVQERPVVQKILTLAAGRPIIVAGSTVDRLHDSTLSEEEIIIQAWEGCPRRELKALLVLAPRHPQRFGEVEAAAMEFPSAKASSIQQTSSLEEEFHPGIFLLDTIGDLAAVYGIANVAIIGGSLVPKGGHNPLEAARFGIPTVMGPSYENFREIVDAMRAADAIRITTADNLAQTLIDLLQNDQGLGQRAKLFFESQTGATTRTVQSILPLLPKP